MHSTVIHLASLKTLDVPKIKSACIVVLFMLTATACAASNGASDGPRKLSKSNEFAAAKPGPWASQIGGNPRKWVGHYVDLDCEITSVRSDDEEADARCGKGVAPVRLVTPQPNLDYGDQNAVNRAMAEQQRQGQQIRREAEDVAEIVLVGDKVTNFDGNQRVTILGPVLRSENDDSARVRVDYAQ